MSFTSVQVRPPSLVKEQVIGPAIPIEAPASSPKKPTVRVSLLNFR